MLARVNGGNVGIAEYLETGIKNGRDFTRDELDQRVILNGDLAITNEIINSIEDRGQERYLHITLSFRESDVSHEILSAVANDYKTLLMSAYGDDEFNFYAEAHLPKIKQIKDRRTGQMVERKPHIHIVIPEKNLLTDGYFNPRGKYTENIKYFEAIQEHINQKYGLESPKDFVRQGDDFHAEMLSRVKGDLYREKHGDMKRELLHKVVSQDIRRHDDFVALAGQYGETVVRNAGKPNEYLAVKMVGDSKFTNLKSPVFKRDYIDGRVLALDKPSPKQIADRLETWKTIASREIKYISNASAKVKAGYKAASLAERRSLLDEKETAYEQRYRTAGREIRQQSRSKFSTQGRSTGLRTGLPSLPERHVVHRAWGQRQGVESVLRGHANRPLDDIGADQHHGLRRHGHGERTGIGRANVLNQLMHEAGEAVIVQQERAQFAEIRRNLQAGRLLTVLQARFALDPGQYRISRAKDGSARINVGRENLNLSDFLTKHMNLPWSEAKPILLACYAQQQQGRVQTRVGYRRAEGLRQSWQQFKQDRQAIFSQKMRWPERQAALSIAIFERLKREERLRDAFGSISSAKEREMQAVQEKNKVAILDTIAPAVPESAFDLQNQLARQQREQAFLQEQATRLRMNDLLADKSAKNQVIYRTKDGSPAFTDKGDSIVFNRKDMEQDKLALGLELAIAKYGESLRLTGSEAFKMKMVEVAAERNLKVSFKPDELQKLLEQRRETLLSQRKPMEKEEGRIVPEFEREVLPTVEATAKREAAIEHIRTKMDAYGKPVAATAADKTVATPGDIMVAHGAAPYQNDPKQKDSYFVTTRDPDGREQTIWGVDLQRAVAESGAQVGDNVALRNLGRQPVTVEEPERNEKGEVIGYRSVQTHRNTWEVECQPALERSRQTDLEKRAEAIVAQLQAGVDLKNSDPLQAKAQVVGAIQQARLMGEECTKAGEGMPAALVSKPSLANAWRDGQLTYQYEKEHGQDHER